MKQELSLVANSNAAVVGLHRRDVEMALEGGQSTLRDAAKAAPAE
jgi:hypothetical protein